MFCFASAVSGQTKLVTVATLDEYSPYCYPHDAPRYKKRDIIAPGSDSARLQGFSWDILRESFHEMGYTIELKVSPWARAMNAVKTGNMDLLFPTGKTKARETIFYYSKEPVNQVDFLIYVRPDSPIRWEGLNSLNNLTIGVMRGWNYGETWKTNNLIKKMPVNRIIQGFKMLDSKRLDGLAGYEIIFDYALKKARMKVPFKKLPVFDSSAEYVVGLKNNEQVIEIITDFDKGRKRIVQNGKYSQIKKKWQ